MSRFVLVDEEKPARRFVLEEEPPKKEAVQRIGDTLLGIPRQLGLTARAGLQGLGSVVGVGSDPIAASINMATGARIPFARQTAQNVADFVGLPKPETPTERVAGTTAELMAGAGGLGGVGNLLSRAPSAVAQQAGQFLAADPARQVSSALGAGLAGGSVKEAGGGSGSELTAALLGSVAGGMAPGAVSGGVNAAKRLTAPKMTDAQIDVRIERALSNQGVDYSALSPAVKQSLRREMGTALQAGDEVSPEALRRLADFRTVGATPTRGTVTLDPVQITREKNLSKMAANSGADELYGLPRIENQNNRALIDNLNTVRGREVDLPTAGERALGVLGAKDARYKAVENRLYGTARDAAGRDVPLDREQFVYRAYEALAKENKGAFLPAEIDGLLSSIRTGTMKLGGQDVPVPFNVDVIDNLKTTLAAASRGAKDGNTRSAISIVRNALENTQPATSPVKTPFGGSQVVTQGMGAQMANADALPGEAMKAFDRARQVARMRRTWQESAPAIKAAMDDAAPDQFVQKFVLSPSASRDDVEALAREVKRSPQALESMKSAIVGHLKDKALNGAADEVGKFSQSAYNKALDALERKLPLFFNREEIAQLQAAGRVASYMQVQPVGSAVNNSNSGAMVLGRTLDAASGLSRFLPFGQSAFADPLKSIQLSLGTRAAQNVGPGLLAPQQPTPVITGSALLPAVLSAGLLSAP
jgi:hypothetical protein